VDILNLGARGKLSEKELYILPMIYIETLFAERKWNFSICLGICFCV